MSYRKMYIYKGLVVILLFGLFSCGNFLDKVGKSTTLPIRQGHINYYRDSNVLIYKPTLVLKRDSEEFMPASFRVNLPKGMKFYEINGPDYFVIYYKNAAQQQL